MPESVSQMEFDLWKVAVAKTFTLLNESMKTLEAEQEESNGPEYNPIVEEIKAELDIFKENYPKLLERLTDLQTKLMSMKEHRKWNFRGKQGDLIRFNSFDYFNYNKPYIDMPLEHVKYLLTKAPDANIELDKVDKDTDDRSLPPDLIRAIESGKIEGIDKLKRNLDIDEEPGEKTPKEETVKGEHLDSEDKAILKFLEKKGNTKTGEIQAALKMSNVVFINKVEKLKRLGKVEETEEDQMKYLQVTPNPD